MSTTQRDDTVSSPGGVQQAQDSTAQRGLRDLMGLLVLPALWLGRDAATILMLMVEAVERVVPLEMSFVDVQVHPESPEVVKLRVAGMEAGPEALQEWRHALDAFRAMPITTAPELMQTPAGPLHVIRLSMGYTAKSGSVWFGSSAQGFPSTTESALLRAAITLAATGLQSVRIDHERARASRVKDEFLAMLGHELRNPLAPIFTSLELIKRQNAGQPLSKPHAIIERQARHMSRLVDDLLDVSRITRGKVELDKNIVSIRSVLKDAAEAVEPMMMQHLHRLSVALPDAGAMVLGDATRLTQVFVNLLTNAAKFTAPGGEISLTAGCDEQQVTVRVVDNGEGLSPALKPRLFDIFEQGVSNIQRTGGGLGIGLALVRSFVELHGGRVQADSEGPGKGSVFTVTLPLTVPPPDAPIPCPLVRPSAQQVAGGWRVMLVDDNADAVETTAIVLQMAGFEVATAGSADEALSLARSFAPDAAILDIGLPGMDGYQLAQVLRGLAGHRRELRLMALSGYGSPGDRARSAAAGFERHLTKPVDMDELVSILVSMQSQAALVTGPGAA